MMRESPLIDRILQIEENTAMTGSGKARIAAFDLDGTLISGDLGETVFRMLVAQEFLSRSLWEQYTAMLRFDRIAAYWHAVEVLAGLDEDCVARATTRVLFEERLPAGVLLTDRERPRPLPVMQQLVSWLQAREWTVAIISASNAISVRVAAAALFDIPPSCAFGVEQTCVGRILTRTLQRPIPIDEGKAEVYRAQFGDVAPLLTAGDSPMDLPLMRLTDPVGLTLWVDSDGAAFRRVSTAWRLPHEMRLVRRPVPSEFAYQDVQLR